MKVKWIVFSIIINVKHFLYVVVVDCEFMFYTYCSKADYIAAGKNELLAIEKKYGPVPLKEFLKNIIGWIQHLFPKWKVKSTAVAVLR